MPTEGRRRPPRSLHGEYQQFIDQRIEEYKDSLPRSEILAIGDEAVQELARTEQIQLTEVVLREQVDGIIRRRLKLPSFRKWRERHLQLRDAQAQPSHWGLNAHDPVVMLAELIEDQDTVLVIGAEDGACALYLAARGAFVQVVDPDLAAVLGLENRAIVEALGGKLECEVATLISYDPDRHPFVACVIEAATVADMSASECSTLIDRLKAATPGGGRHVIMPIGDDRGAEAARHLSSDALRTLYNDWQVVLAPSTGPGLRKGNAGFLATCTASAPASD